MALVNFYLHHKKGKGSGQTALIRLQYLCEDGENYTDPMKERIKVSHWKKGSQRLIPSAKSAGSINRYLDKQQERVEQAIRDIRSRGKKVTKHALVYELTGQEMPFWEFFDSYIQKQTSTKQMCELLHNNLRELERINKISLDFDGIDQRLADMLTAQMSKNQLGKRGEDGTFKPIDEPYADSTIATIFGILNGVLSKAKKDKIIKEFEPLTTSATGIDSGAVYTTPAEIRMMLAVGHAYHLPGDKRRVVSLRTSAFFYALGTQLGLRSIDLSVSRDNVLVVDGDEYLNMKNQKTGRVVLLPISSLAKMTLNYFGWKRPKLSIVTFRNCLPVIAKYAGMHEPAIHRRMIAGKIVETVYRKYEMIEPHTMRRAFATNFIEAGANPMDVMEVGGWTTWDSFIKYVRMASKSAAKRLAAFQR